MKYCLGKTPARHAIKYKFGTYFDERKLPTPPPVFGHHILVPTFYPLGNNDYANCVFAGAAHEHQVWNVASGHDRPRFTTKDVLSDYSAVTGFDPAKKNTDNGTDMKDASSYRRRVGIIDAVGKRHRVDSYVSLEIGNLDQLFLVMYLMGAAGIGLQVPSSIMDDFAHYRPWAVPSAPKMIGGHYVPGVGRDKDGNIVIVSWGKVTTITPQFYERFNDESVCHLSLDLLSAKNLSPEGFDEAALRQHLARIG